MVQKKVLKHSLLQDFVGDRITIYYKAPEEDNSNSTLYLYTRMGTFTHTGNFSRPITCDGEWVKENTIDIFVKSAQHWCCTVNGGLIFRWREERHQYKFIDSNDRKYIIYCPLYFL